MSNKKDNLTYAQAIDLALTEVTNKEVVEKLTKLKEQVTKKNSSTDKKPTKTQVENEKIREQIFEEMEVGKAYTITTLIKSLPCLADEKFSNQKATHLLQNMIGEESDGKVVRTEEKGKAYYTRVE